MLCHQCRRLAATIIQRGTNALSQRARLMHTSSSQSRIGALLQPAFHSSVRPRRTAIRSYSASTPTEARTANAPSLPEKPDYLDNDESAIWDKLTAEFAPTELTVQDISGGCGSMYAIEIASEKFRGTNMLKQQRMVNAVLGEQMKNWHGVQLRTKVP
ncbi:bola-like protein [Annulohypoxylon truncatum]|uniref:bola-like protein n=1 Tax=Annulohypoxylon truncatum TaxID=327061 RepID=UPI002007CAF1|nr:bola-like protein [Annulohypoxylon truncatum]KAI1213296.1 bola-like protein [Annulohypoxylon truncatum]